MKRARRQRAMTHTSGTRTEEDHRGKMLKGTGTLVQYLFAKKLMRSNVIEREIWNQQHYREKKHVPRPWFD